jgi:hypothetical protein
MSKQKNNTKTVTDTREWAQAKERRLWKLYREYFHA